MRALVLYHPQSDHVGIVEEYAHDYRRFKGRELELVSLETKAGADLATLYDVTTYPAVLVIGPEGSLIDLWQNGIFPLMDQLSAAAGDTDIEQKIISHSGKQLWPTSA